jgi:hypothetical protein
LEIGYSFVIELGSCFETEQTMTDRYAPRGFGEPLDLPGGAMYFTSWKYIRQGGWHWPAQKVFDPTDPLALIGEQVEQDGRPSDYEPRNLPRGLKLVAQKAQKLPMNLLVDGQPVSVHTLVQDGERYLLWHVFGGAGGDGSPSRKGNVLAMAESSDGINFKSLGVCEGLTRGFGGGSVFIDPSSTHERFKLIHDGTMSDAEQAAWDAKYPGEACPMARRPNAHGEATNHCLFGAVSSDGVHWKSLDEAIMCHFADTRNTCYYDIDRRLYVAYVRIWEANPQNDEMAAKYPVGWGGVGRRAIGRAVSTDFRHFSKAQVVIATSADMAPSHLWYNNAKATLPGCPDQHIMLPWRWQMEIDGGDSYMFSTNDGWAWSQVPGGPVLQRGPVGSSDGEYTVFGGSMVELPDERWAVPYRGYAVPHKYPGQDVKTRKGLFPGVPHVAGLAVWPKGRLVAIDCEDGEFATVAVVPPGSRIHLNAAVRPAGFLQVGVEQFRGSPIPGRGLDDCDRLVGDSVSMPVTWSGEPDLNHGGEPILLRFRLRHAQLFGVTFGQ